MNIIKSDKLFISLVISSFIFGCSNPVTTTEKKQLVKIVSVIPTAQVINNSQTSLPKPSLGETVSSTSELTLTPTVIPQPEITPPPQPTSSTTQQSTGSISNTSDSSSNSSFQSVNEPQFIAPSGGIFQPTSPPQAKPTAVPTPFI